MIVLCVIGFATLPLTTAATKAESYCDRISDPLRRGNCYQQEVATQQQNARWRSYTPRQRQLSRTISQIVTDYFQRTGQALPVTQETVSQVMQMVGASRSEAAFVIDRMVANSNAYAGMNQANDTIDRTQRFLDCLQTQGTGCIP
jgi:hypothetical protein